MGGIIVNHHGDFESFDHLFGHGQADETAPILCHEIDRIGSDLFCGDGQVTLVLTVLIVNENHHFPMTDILNGFLDRTQHNLLPLVTGFISVPSSIHQRVGIRLHP